MKLISLFFLMLFLACGEKEKKDPTKGQPLLDNDQIENLQKKVDLYTKLSKEKLDEKNWITDTKCDGTLFQSLYSLSTGVSDPYAAEDKQTQGKYYRWHEQNCYSNHLNGISGGSTSETSRDMYIGLFTYLLAKKDGKSIQEIIDYGESENWIMGKADRLGAVEFRPDTQGIVYQLHFYLNEVDSLTRKVPLAYNKCKDFSCHLRALAIWLMHDAERYGDRDRNALLDLTEYDNRNALFLGLYAKFEDSRTHAQKAYQTLMNEQWFPNERLPRSTDRCGFYLFERGPDSNAWIPCKAQGKDKGDKEWMGIDFLTASYVLLEI